MTKTDRVLLHYKFPGKYIFFPPTKIIHPLSPTTRVVTMAKIALGSSREAVQSDCIKALVVEFIATFLFVFAGVGSAMAAGNTCSTYQIIYLYNCFGDLFINTEQIG